MSLVRRQAWKFLLVLSAAITVSYVLAPRRLWADLVFYDGTVALVVVAIIGGVVLHRPARRAPWLLFALGHCLLLCGELSFWYLDVTGQDPFPSFADYFYLSAYPILALGLLLLVREHSPVRDLFGGLDAAILAAAAGLLSWVYLMEPYATDVEYSTSDKVWSLAYPVMDLVLIAMAARLLFALQVRSWATSLLSAWLGFTIGADVLYGWSILQGTYEPGGSLDGIWMIGYACVGAAALHPSMAAPVEQRRTDRFKVGNGRMTVLGLAAIVPPLVLIGQQIQATDGNNTKFVPAIATLVIFVLVSIRMGGLVGTVRRLAERRGQEQFEAMVEHSADVISVVDDDLNIVYASPAVRSMYGLDATDVVGRPVDQLVAAEDRAPLRAQLLRIAELDEGATSSFSAQFVRADGARGTFEAVIANLRMSAGGSVVTINDVTAQAELESQLSHRAFHDSLTDLPNRALFVDRVTHALARHNRSTDRVAVLFIDVDDFKSVNDALGHAAGDDLLLSIGQRLLLCLRAGDTIARLGGDEFAVLLDGDAGLAECIALADRILEVLQLPMTVGELELGIRVSIGIALGTTTSTTQSLLRDADIAMYDAKGSGKGCYAVFDPSMREAASEHLALRTDLAQALDRGELRVVYQPIVELETEAFVGAEALLRWEHPERGNIRPDQFIPIAEQSGLIVPIGRWVLRQACELAATWQVEGQPRSISVNASGAQFRDLALVDDITSALEASGLSPELLTIEITETVLMDDTEKAAGILEMISSLGVRLAIDDFGTGYCSLAYVRNFPVDVIKIDRAFVTELDDPTRTGGLAENILALTASLDVPAVAEGIEHQAQADRLRSMNCQFGQGFLFARPLEATAIADVLCAASPPPNVGARHNVRG